MSALLEKLESQGSAEALWTAQPFQLVTLLDMKPFVVGAFSRAVHRLDELDCQFKISISQRGQDSILTENERKPIFANLVALYLHCKNVGFTRATERYEDIKQELEESDVSLRRMREQLAELRRAIARDMKEQAFVSIPKEDTKKYEQQGLFGPKVRRNFKSTRNDVKEAGNCYALGRYDACVFHCMRALEKGLRALVNELNSKHGAGIDFKKKVDGENWGDILITIQKRLEQRPLDMSPAPTKAQRRFYSKALREFGYFKKAWRNDVAHGNEYYNQKEAERVIDHVQTFMVEIADYGLTEQFK